MRRQIKPSVRRISDVTVPFWDVSSEKILEISFLELINFEPH